MFEVGIELFKSVKNNDRVLIYLMLISLFLCLSFTLGVNPSVALIIEDLLGIDILPFVLILYNYLVLAYAFFGFLWFIFVVLYIISNAIYVKVEDSTTHAHDRSLYISCFAYGGLQRLLKILYYIIFLILLIGSILVSENTDLENLLLYTNNFFGETWVSLLAVFGCLLIVFRSMVWWDNFRFMIDNPIEKDTGNKLEQLIKEISTK
ncbi:MAG: hypothetical protein HY818_16400 [Acetobacterium woodii]|nr:hypothetical protein [Acetobacterium woodii]